MGKENRPKTDNLAWIKALLFPKKGKPITTVQPAKFDPPAPAEQTRPSQPAPSPASPASPQTASQPSRLKLSQPATSASAALATPSQPPQKSALAAPPAEKPPAVTVKQAENSPPAPEKKRKFLPAFWTVASVFSMIVNVILVIVLLVLVRELFTLKALVGDQLLGGLYNNFVLMDEAHIKTTILVETEVPVQFTLPVQTDTTVQLTEDTRINGARVTLNTGGLNILSAPTNIVLPAGTNLPIALDITVPVNTTIPIVLEVPVDIPLAETELHEPFVGLQDVVGPYYFMLWPEIQGPDDVPLCKSAMWLCRIFFRIE
ncbi:MAG: hypothetical protein R6W69_01600 [Anaerolineales bacterium]